MSLASITVSGTLKENPEKKLTPTNVPVANLKLEICFVPRGSGVQPGVLSSQIVRVNAWRDLAEYCEQKLKAGDKVIVTGKVMINAFKTNDGKNKRVLEIDATSIVPIKNILELQPPLKKDSNEQEKETFKQTSSNIEQTSNLDEITNTEEIPF